MSAGCAEDMRERPFSTKAVFAVAVTAALKTTNEAASNR
jgi:hypothetical protein